MNLNHPNSEFPKENIEVERKYKVQLIDHSIPIDFKAYEIFQTYLQTDQSQEERIRKIVSKNKIKFIHTIKKPISATERVEMEHEITKEIYNSLSSRQAPNSHIIHKTRSVCVYKNQLFELDHYHSPKLNYLILEIEKVQHHKHIVFPDFIIVLEDVTGQKEYSNFEISRIKNV